MQDIEQLYQLYHRQLFAYLYYLCAGDSLLAEELLQETFYQAILSSVRFRGEAKVSTWLYQIAKYTYNAYRRREALQARSLPLREPMVGDTPESLYMELEGQERLLAVVQELSDSYKNVVVLRGVNDLSFAEVGAIMGQSENWAKVTFYRAKTKMQKLLKGGEGD